MMAREHHSIWQRFSNLFAAEGGNTDGGDGNGSSKVTPGPDGVTKTASAPIELVTGSRQTSWWRRGQERRARAQEATLRVAELSDAIQRHFRHQEERTAELAGSLGRVGSVLEQLAETQRAQGDCLKSIAEHSEHAGKHAARLSDTIGRIPDSLLTQAEAIRSVATQLDLSQESDTQLMHSLQQFGRAVDTLGSAGQAQVTALQGLSTSHREQNEAFTKLVREQHRRFLITICIVGGLAVAALAALTGALILSISA